LTWYDLIFVAGGQDVNGNVLSSTEVYNLSTGGPWFTGFSMNTPREDFGISLAADGYLHAFGGKTKGGTAVDSIEGYKFSTGTWTVEPHSLPVALSGLAATETLNGAVLVIGGQKTKGLQETVIRVVPPSEPSHSVTFFVHTDDQPYVDGNQAMTLNNNTARQSFGFSRRPKTVF
jgi:hypothetical protein